MYKVLVVEDEDLIRKGLIFTMDWLKADCAVVGEAADGEEGLQKIEELRPDIVITDVKMPFMDGIAMLEASILRYAYEAIIISGYGEFSYAQKAISLNVTEYLIKPLDFALLYQALKKITVKLDESRAIKNYLAAKERESAHSALQLLQMARPQTKNVGRMLDYIKDAYAQKISLSDLSEEYGVSTTYLNMQFKKETNYTFNDFLNRYRVLRAVDLLRNGGMKVYEVALAVGFQDYKYFIQVFKKYTGYSPSRFVGERRLHSQSPEHGR